VRGLADKVAIARGAGIDLNADAAAATAEAVRAAGGSAEAEVCRMPLDAPITEQLILSFIAERVLDQPKSN